MNSAVQRLQHLWWQLTGGEARHIEQQARRVAAGWTPRWFGTLFLACPPPPDVSITVKDGITPALERMAKALANMGLPAEEAARRLAVGQRFLERERPQFEMLQRMVDETLERKDSHAGGGKSDV